MEFGPKCFVIQTSSAAASFLRLIQNNVCLVVMKTDVIY